VASLIDGFLFATVRSLKKSGGLRVNEDGHAYATGKTM
jgi:hypothetical protein